MRPARHREGFKSEYGKNAPGLIRERIMKGMRIFQFSQNFCEVINKFNNLHEKENYYYIFESILTLRCETCKSACCSALPNDTEFLSLKSINMDVCYQIASTVISCKFCKKAFRQFQKELQFYFANFTKKYKSQKDWKPFEKLCKKELPVLGTVLQSAMRLFFEQKGRIDREAYIKKSPAKPKVKEYIQRFMRDDFLERFG